MLTTASPVQSAVHTEIRALLIESGIETGPLRGDEELRELGLSSLQLAQLIIQMEAQLGVDPFAEDDAAFDARTVDALVALYERALQRRAVVGASA